MSAHLYIAHRATTQCMWVSFPMLKQAVLDRRVVYLLRLFQATFPVSPHFDFSTFPELAGGELIPVRDGTSMELCLAAQLRVILLKLMLIRMVRRLATNGAWLV